MNVILNEQKNDFFTNFSLEKLKQKIFTKIKQFDTFSNEYIQEKINY